MYVLAGKAAICFGCWVGPLRRFVSRRSVFMEAELICSVKGAVEDIFGDCGEADVSGAVASPAAGDGEEHVGEFGYESLLLGRVEQEVAVALFDRGERGEDAAPNTKVNGAHVGAFFGIGEAESDTAKVAGVHRIVPRRHYRLWHKARRQRQFFGDGRLALKAR